MISKKNNNIKHSSKFVLLILVVFFSACNASKNASTTAKTSNKYESPTAVLAMIEKVNEYWQKNHPEQDRSFWNPAAYHTGNIEAYKLTSKPEFLNYSKAWAEKNKYMGAKSTDKSEWKYSYGETDKHVLFGDWQICFQTYIDIYQLEGSVDKTKINRAIEVMEYQMSTDKNDYWWWADGLYMVMPVMTKLYLITGNNLYLEKLHQYWLHANTIMYDPDTQLYFRDAKYVYPKHKTINGKKDFWARGDGWVFAALAKIIQDLPKDAPYRNEYITRFKVMAAAIKAAQQDAGYWTRSMIDPAHAPGPETSGTAFFTYGFLWGMNHGLLSQKEYEPVVEKSWTYLTKVALQPDGSVGYVQPIGERAIPGQGVGKNSTADFGVGAFLLASCEMYRFLKK